MKKKLAAVGTKFSNDCRNNNNNNNNKYIIIQFSECRGIRDMEFVITPVRQSSILKIHFNKQVCIQPSKIENRCDFCSAVVDYY